MSAITVGTAKIESGKYVQQMFDWESPMVAEPRCAVAAKDAVVQAASQPVEQPKAAAGQVRRGRCEHVGSVMATVLGKYGLSIDDLLRAIEERQSQLGISR